MNLKKEAFIELEERCGNSSGWGKGGQAMCLKDLTSQEQYMSPVSPVFHTVVTVKLLTHQVSFHLGNKSSIGLIPDRGT